MTGILKFRTDSSSSWQEVSLGKESVTSNDVTYSGSVDATTVYEAIEALKSLFEDCEWGKFADLIQQK